jgi:hypothetical protein
VVKPRANLSTASRPLLAALADIEGRIERRHEWRVGYDAGLRAGAQRVFESQALEQLAVELKFLRAALPKVLRQLEHVNAGRVDALRRVVWLARKLDALAPGWDQ